MPIPTIILFDIDGTLIDSGGAGRCALEQAFRTLYGTAAWLDFSFAGMTDREIVRLALMAGGHEGAESSVFEVIERYLELLPAAVHAARAFRVFPGVRALLQQLARRSRCALGLGTGNVERGARIKLGRAGLDRTFSFGGFGCDHHERARLLAVGARRGADLLAVPRAQCRTIVVGDTTRDVLAGLAIGAECVGVGTGPCSSEELLAAGATAAYPDLSAEGVWDIFAYRGLRR